MDAVRIAPYPAPAGIGALPLKATIGGTSPTTSSALPLKVTITASSPLWSMGREDLSKCPRSMGWDTSSCDTDNERGSDGSSSWALEESPMPMHTPLRGQAKPYCPAGSAAPAKKPRQNKKKKAAKEPEAKTTVMICNLPFDHTSDTLIDLLDSMGFARHFDFVYVPVNMTEMRSVGYGFVNLLTNELAERLMSAFDGFDSWATEQPAAGACEVRWSTCNGLKANVSRNQNSPIMADSVPAICKPVLLRDGVRVPFPEPVKQLRAIRVRKGKMQESSESGHTAAM